jgi:hypothetical protein
MLAEMEDPIQMENSRMEKARAHEWARADDCNPVRSWGHNEVAVIE